MHCTRRLQYDTRHHIKPRESTSRLLNLIRGIKAQESTVQYQRNAKYVTWHQRENDKVLRIHCKCKPQIPHEAEYSRNPVINWCAAVPEANVFLRCKSQFEQEKVSHNVFFNLITASIQVRHSIRISTDDVLNIHTWVWDLVVPFCTFLKQWKV